MMNKENKSEYLWTIVAVLGFVVILIIGYKIKASLSPQITATTERDASCDLRQGKCLSKLPYGGTVSLLITPKTLPSLHPLALTVEVNGAKVSTIKVDFIGVEMDMGYNRSKLHKVDEHHFEGKAMIPVCVHSKMEWEARVLLQTEKGPVMAPFRFYTIK
jgi:hypothetical protein